MSSGDMVSVGEDGSLLWMDSGDDTAVGMYLMPLHWTLKTVKIINFMLCIFYHHLKNYHIF